PSCRAPSRPAARSAPTARARTAAAATSCSPPAVAPTAPTTATPATSRRAAVARSTTEPETRWRNDTGLGQAAPGPRRYLAAPLRAGDRVADQVRSRGAWLGQRGEDHADRETDPQQASGHRAHDRGPRVLLAAPYPEDQQQGKHRLDREGLLG